MGGPNGKMFSETSGRVRILAIILGAIAVVLTADHYFVNITEEKAFWWSLVVCLIIMAVFAILSLLGLADNDMVQKLDTLFYTLAAILLIIVSCFFIYRVDQTKNFYYERRAAAGAFGLFEGIACGYIVRFWF